MGAHVSCDGMREAGSPGLARWGAALGAEGVPAAGRAGMDGVHRWRRIPMKGSWLLAPLLASLLGLGEVAATWVVGEFHVPRVHPAAPGLDDAGRLAAAVGGWEALLEVGDAAQRIGTGAGSSETVDGRAREIYRSALARARQQESLDGVLRVAEVLATLGDREGFKEGIRVAKVLAGGDPEAQADLRAVATQFPDSLC